jgi:hypothetical protein
VAIGPSEILCYVGIGHDLVMYDVYWLAMMILFMGSKYLECVSSIPIMLNKDDN